MNETATGLSAKRCKPAGSVTVLSQDEIERLLRCLDGWTCRDGAIAKSLRFSSYAENMAFVNAVAWIAQRQDHHPDLHVGYDTCRVAYRTHTAGGITENDFICAAKIDALLRL
jgi:4a-hydroxytetrahydrobiopterin dehydratase